MAILISAGADASAYKLEQILKPQTLVCFVDHLPLPKYRTAKREFIQVPKGDSPVFAHSLLALCLDYDIAEIYPLREDELIPLAESVLLFAEFGIGVYVPSTQNLALLLAEHLAVAGELAVVKSGKVIYGYNGANKIPADLSGVFLIDQNTGGFSIFRAH